MTIDVDSQMQPRPSPASLSADPHHVLLSAPARREQSTMSSKMVPLVDDDAEEQDLVSSLPVSGTASSADGRSHSSS